jgi:hypothetical protein
MAARYIAARRHSSKPPKAATVSTDPPLARSGASNHPGRGALDSGLALLVDILKRKRTRKKMSMASLARRARVPVETVMKLEAYEVNAIGLWDLISIGTALGSKLSVTLAPIRPELPKANNEVLQEFDKVIRSRSCNPFVRNETDKEHPHLRWDIVGDKKRNWLFVVVSHRKKKLRFAKVTDEPGGWAIAGQVFGIDAETDAIARELSDRVFKEHRAELAGPPITRKPGAVTE